MLGDPLDRAVLAGGVTALQHHQDLLAGLHRLRLPAHQRHLQLMKVLLVIEMLGHAVLSGFAPKGADAIMGSVQEARTKKRVQQAERALQARDARSAMGLGRGVDSPE